MTKDNILAEDKPKFIKLADGKDYELPVMNLTTFINIEKTIGFGLAQLPQKVIEETALTIGKVIYALLKENYPDITKEKVGDLVNFQVMRDISKVLSEIIANMA